MEFKASLVYMASSRLMLLLPVLFNIMTSKTKTVAEGGLSSILSEPCFGLVLCDLMDRVRLSWYI